MNEMREIEHDMNTGLSWSEAWGLASETRAPRLTIWWRCDLAFLRRGGWLE